MNILSLIISLMITIFCNTEVNYKIDTVAKILYTFSEESDPHEGIWLHGKKFRNNLDPTWIEITKKLITSEKVHIIAYNNTEKNRIVNLLTAQSIDLTNVDFNMYPNDDFWVRKNGEVYNFLKLPLTQNNVDTTYGKKLRYRGSYCNYYIANIKILVPIYNNPNDSVTLQLLQTIYPSRTVIGIDFRNGYAT